MNINGTIISIIVSIIVFLIIIIFILFMNIIENKNKEIKELTRIIENLIYKEFNKMNEIYDNNDKDFNKLNQMLNNNDKELKKLKKMIFIDNSSNNDKLH